MHRCCQLYDALVGLLLSSCCIQISTKLLANRLCGTVSRVLRLCAAQYLWLLRSCVGRGLAATMGDADLKLKFERELEGFKQLQRGMLNTHDSVEVLGTC